jgi:hypothetical protein
MAVMYNLEGENVEQAVVDIQPTHIKTAQMR